MPTERKQTPQERWDKENKKRFNLVLIKSTESDIIEHLEKQSNKNGYVKGLIKKDMQN